MITEYVSCILTYAELKFTYAFHLSEMVGQTCLFVNARRDFEGLVLQILQNGAFWKWDALFWCFNVELRVGLWNDITTRPVSPKCLTIWVDNPLNRVKLTPVSPCALCKVHNGLIPIDSKNTISESQHAEPGTLTPSVLSSHIRIY